jgi:murein DD-endopeptidase MepM/ murein hydrolase activator NlpD
MKGWALTATAVIALTGACTNSEPELATADLPRVCVEPIPRFRVPVRTEATAGDTIESVCRRLAGPDWVAWRDGLLEELDPRRLRPGTVFAGHRSSDGRLEHLRVVLDLRTELELERTGSGVCVKRVEREVASEVLRIEGVVESSLFAAVADAGGRPDLAVRLAEIFQWDIDFLRDLRSGDRFTAIVDSQSVDGEFYQYGIIFAARFVNQGRSLDAIVYPDANGRLGYYDLEGKPLRKQFLRSPLKFSRITSRFSMHRFHPVLKKTIPHYGVDYGAPVGTAVHATADGVVQYVGVKGGAGKMVRVRHPNGYETSYLHLSRYGQGVRVGARVGQGQVLGFVGSSGLSTGPHLDYRVTLNGKWINPLSISSPPADPLPADRLGRFLAHALTLASVLEGHEVPIGATC